MTRAELNAFILEKLPDNILKLITPEKHRQVEAAILDYVDQLGDDMSDALSTGLSTKVSNSTYNSGLASQAAVNSNFSVIIGTLFEGLTYRGTYETFEELETALPGPPGDDYASGDYAVVDNGADPAVVYIWDTVDGWVIGSPPVAVSYVTGTRDEIDELVDDGLLKPGATYFITEASSGSLRSLLLRAISTNSFDKQGVGFFEVPSFSIGDISADSSFSGCPIPANDFKGVWTIALESSLVNGDVVQLGGKHFQVTSAASMDGTGPDPDAIANGFTPLEFGAANVGYTLEGDVIEYDYQFGQNTLRIDKRNNVVRGQEAIDSFQWGNNEVFENVVFPGATWTCIDQRGTIKNNQVTGEVNVQTGSRHAGTIERTFFGGGGYDIVAQKTDANERVSGCHILPPDDYGDISLREADDDIGKTITPFFSNFSGVIGAVGDEISFESAFFSHLGVIVAQESAGTIVNKIKPLTPSNPSFEMIFEMRADIGQVLRFRPTQPVDVADNYFILFPGNSNAILTLDGDKQHFAKFRARIMSLPGGLFFVNELVETNAQVIGPARYKATLTQTGTDAPVASVIENTLDPDVYSPALSYVSVGNYELDFGAAITPSKVAIRGAGRSVNNIAKEVHYEFTGSTINIYTQDGASVNINDVLTNQLIEFEIYP